MHTYRYICLPISLVDLKRSRDFAGGMILHSALDGIYDIRCG